MSRPRIGVVVSAPNTVLERDLWRIGDDRATWHSSRVPDHPYDAGDPSDHAASVAALAGGTGAAIEALAPVRPAAVVVGLSAAPFRAGLEGHRRWKASLEAFAGVPVVTLADGIADALARLGVRTVALLTPLHPDANAPIAAYLTELGATVHSAAGLSCGDVAAIAAVSAARLHDAVDGLDAPGVEAIIQVGTNLPFASVAAEASRRLGKPVVAGNAALTVVAIARAA